MPRSKKVLEMIKELELEEEEFIPPPPPTCEYIFQTTKRKGQRCTNKISKRDCSNKWCSAHYRIRGRKDIPPIVPLEQPESSPVEIIVAPIAAVEVLPKIYTDEQLERFKIRYDEERKRIEDERLYRRFRASKDRERMESTH